MLALFAGTPLFLCLPPWNDVTLHDMAVRSILCGGVHYRDVFDTNLPGIDWAMAAVRSVFGWSYEALRAADLVVISTVVVVLCGWVRRCGAPGYAVAWLAAAAALFYPFTSEFNHVQRDPWMLLPAVVAACLRLRRVRVSIASRSAVDAHAGGELQLTGNVTLERTRCLCPVAASILEGFLWGLAVWVKPHAVVPAFIVWAVSVAILARRESWRILATDFGALILGGLLAGVPGVIWLVATGAWPYFLDIFLNWNPAYLSGAGATTANLRALFTSFGAWSIIHIAALPLAFCAVVTGIRTSRVNSARALLAALYLGWLAQLLFLQKPFEYAHLPPTLLAMAVVACRGWCIGFAYLIWFAALGAIMQFTHVPLHLEPHRLTQAGVMQLWPRCCREGSSPELRDRLGQFQNTIWDTNWEELRDVAAYLRAVEHPPGPGELNCWHDTTHPLYLMLNLDPATRYMHYGTVFGIRDKRPVIAEEVRASRQRYVVSDLIRTTPDSEKVYDPASWRASDPLPIWLPASERQKFPWNQPVVFRSGRYVVHRVDHTKPLGVIRVPDWDTVPYLDRLGSAE